MDVFGLGGYGSDDGEERQSIAGSESEEDGSDASDASRFVQSSSLNQSSGQS